MSRGEANSPLPTARACSRQTPPSLFFKSGASRTAGRRLGEAGRDGQSAASGGRGGQWPGGGGGAEVTRSRLLARATGRAAGVPLSLGSDHPPAMMNEQMQEMEEVSKELLKLLAAGGAGNLLKRSLDKQEKMFDKLLDTQLTAAQLVKDLLATEEKVAQTLLAGEEEMQSSLQKVQVMETALRRASEDNASLRADSSALRRELEELRAELGRLQDDMEDDTGMVNSATYIAQLYYQISRIDWDYECEQPHIKGIHHGRSHLRTAPSFAPVQGAHEQGSGHPSE
ncbi:kinetochore protein Spc24 [Chrysemys picta bellii]|uniref:kinetochore protein Spc24 n=1 Tax=Chrysemys picta bellii TaxID=8478 RepID=UPI0032B1C4AB